MVYSSIKKFLQELKQLTKSESVPCVGGRSDLPIQPGLKVKGRHISLPVNQQELEWLCKEGKESPFGKGMDTILDNNIRRSIEFEAQDTELLNPHWKSALEKLIESVSAEMGIDFQIEAELFKLLIYQEGGHFKFHQDTEKTSGMFGTLIVQLPSRCQGGSLVCRFYDKEYCFDFGNKEADSEFSIYYAAHYADVQHQVEKIEEGARLVLIYNLIQPIKERRLSAKHHKQLLDSARGIVPSIFTTLSQEQHAILLQHEYTEQSLSEFGFLATKGRDRALVKAMLALNEHLPLEQKLYFMISRMSYSVTSECCGGGYSRYGDYDEDDIDWEEVESSEPVCDVSFDEEGQITPTDNFSIDWVHDLNVKEIESIEVDRIDDNFWREGDDHIEGYMGNYGPTKETTYARHLLILMPAYPANIDGFSQNAVFEAHRTLLMAQDLRKHPDCDWLQERFDQALKNVAIKFNSIVSETDTSSHWGRGFDANGQVIFTKLLKIAIAGDDDVLCQNLVIKAKESLVSVLSLEFQAKNLLSPLKDAINHFGWETLSTPCSSVFTALSGSVAFKLSIALAEENADINMRAQLMNICVNAVCREKKSWGGECGFTETILPLAINLCTKDWHSSDKAKDQFLKTCLQKSEEQPSFLSVLIQKLITNTQANNKQWFLNPLITGRLKYLENDLNKEPKEFTWSMPNANVRNRAIASFLQGEGKETEVTGYDGIAMARNDVINVESKWILPAYHMESSGDFLKPRRNYGFSSNMQAKGRGKNAYIEIKKDTRYYELCLKLRELRKKEFEKLKKIIESKTVI